MAQRLTIKEIVHRLGIAYDTFYGWRRGSSNRTPLRTYQERKGLGLVVHVEEDDLIEFLGRYRPDLLARWRRDIDAACRAGGE
jgi:hypothetical protein